MIRRTTREIASTARAVNTSEPTGDPDAVIIMVASIYVDVKPSRLARLELWMEIVEAKNPRGRRGSMHYVTRRPTL
jgi:hypothetical protein